jgi:hypothetical protein
MIDRVMVKINNRFENEDSTTKAEVLDLLIEEIDIENDKKVKEGLLTNDNVPKRKTLLKYLNNMDLDYLLRKYEHFY